MQINTNFSDQIHVEKNTHVISNPNIGGIINQLMETITS